MRSWSTRRWRKGLAGFSSRCPPGPDVVCRYLMTPNPNARDLMVGPDDESCPPDSLVLEQFNRKFDSTLRVGHRRDDDQPTNVLKAGESFYEPTECLHRVRENPAAMGKAFSIAVILTHEMPSCWSSRSRRKSEA